MRYAVKKGGEWTICNLVPKSQYGIPVSVEDDPLRDMCDQVWSEVGTTALICGKDQAEKVVELD